MCGIWGRRSSQQIIKDESINQHFQIIKHRGPDGQGFYENVNCQLGHVLLAIQDPGNSSQPMVSCSGKQVIVFNGEIYNFKDLNNKYGLKNLRSNSDTEVLLELLEIYRDKILKELEGMFAFGLYIVESGELVLSRDRFGEKPIYYSKRGEEIAFSSHPKGVAESLKNPICLEKNLIAHFLKYQYLPSGKSLYSEIKQVNPGSQLIFGREIGRAHV